MRSIYVFGITYHVAYTANRERSVVQWPTVTAICIFTRFVLFFNDCDSSSGINNLRPTYGTIPIRLKMNTFVSKRLMVYLQSF